jgi:hypothetical protein
MLADLRFDAFSDLSTRHTYIQQWLQDIFEVAVTQHALSATQPDDKHGITDKRTYTA